MRLLFQRAAPTGPPPPMPTPDGSAVVVVRPSARPTRPLLATVALHLQVTSTLLIGLLAVSALQQSLPPAALALLLLPGAVLALAAHRATRTLRRVRSVREEDVRLLDGPDAVRVALAWAAYRDAGAPGVPARLWDLGVAATAHREALSQAVPLERAAARREAIEHTTRDLAAARGALDAVVGSPLPDLSADRDLLDPPER